MILRMEHSNKLIGAFARLPDGQLVRIETIYADGFASVRRVKGKWKGQKAVCLIARLEPVRR
jgi:hypothetical protein